MKDYDPRQTRVSFEEIDELHHLDLTNPPIKDKDGNPLPIDADILFTYNVVAQKIIPIEMSTFFDGHIVIGEFTDSTLEKDITTTHKIGNLVEGSFFEKGWTLTQVMEKLLTVPNDPVASVNIVPSIIYTWINNSLTLVAAFSGNSAGPLESIVTWKIDGTPTSTIEKSLTPPPVILNISSDINTLYSIEINYAEGIGLPAGTIEVGKNVKGVYPTFYGSSIDNVGSDVDAARLAEILTVGNTGFTATPTDLLGTKQIKINHNNLGAGKKYHWTAIPEKYGPLVRWYDSVIQTNNGMVEDGYNNKIIVYKGVRYIVYNKLTATEFSYPLIYTT